MWYDLYCYKDAKYDPRYIPGDCIGKKYTLRLITRVFAMHTRINASIISCFLSQAARTIVRNSNHCFFDGAGNIISFAQPKALLERSRDL